MSRQTNAWPRGIPSVIISASSPMEAMKSITARTLMHTHTHENAQTRTQAARTLLKERRVCERRVGQEAISPTGCITVCVFSQNACVVTSQDLRDFLHLDTIPPKICIADDDRQMFVSFYGPDLFNGTARTVQGLVTRGTVSAEQANATDCKVRSDHLM